MQSLYALTYYQVVCEFCARATAEGRAALVAGARAREAPGLRAAARLMLAALAGSDLFTEDGAPGDRAESPDLLDMEQQVTSPNYPYLVHVRTTVLHRLCAGQLLC